MENHEKLILYVKEAIKAAKSDRNKLNIYFESAGRLEVLNEFLICWYQHFFDCADWYMESMSENDWKDLANSGYKQINANIDTFGTCFDLFRVGVKKQLHELAEKINSIWPQTV